MTSNIKIIIIGSIIDDNKINNTFVNKGWKVCTLYIATPRDYMWLCCIKNVATRLNPSTKSIIGIMTTSNESQFMPQQIAFDLTKAFDEINGWVWEF